MTIVLLFSGPSLDGPGVSIKAKSIFLYFSGKGYERVSIVFSPDNSNLLHGHWMLIPGMGLRLFKYEPPYRIQNSLVGCHFAMATDFWSENALSAQAMEFPDKFF